MLEKIVESDDRCTVCRVHICFMWHMTTVMKQGFETIRKYRDECAYLEQTIL